MNLRVLDGLRGLTALYVLLYHANGLLWTGATADAAPLTWLLQNLFSFGHQAVLLFFLISGFCIHHRQAQKRSTRVQVVQFAWRRARRLYPPLLLALIVTAVLDHLGGALSPQLYALPSNFWEGPVTVGSSYSLQTLIGNLAFQARLSVPEMGSNSPLWSLAYEFWFYALYPLMLAGFVRLGATRAAVVIGLVSAASWLVLDWLPSWHLRVLADWAVWAFGALLAEAYVRGACPKVVRWCGPLAPVALVAMAYLSPIGPDHERIPDLWWGAVMGLGLAYVLLDGRTLAARLFERLCLGCSWLGQISYSLYLVHYPLLVLLGAVWVAVRGSLPLGAELVMAGVVLAVDFGWLAWFAVERHCVPGARRAVQDRPAAARAARIRSTWSPATPSSRS